MMQNLALTGRFLNEIVENPNILDEIPKGAMVFLRPEDDSELAEQNRVGAERASRAGYAVYVRTLRPPTRASKARGND